jgi:membrane protein implicated in regulation of membrane protease activity
MVFLQGELWRATADSEIPKGSRARVKQVSGLLVKVEPDKASEDLKAV